VDQVVLPGPRSHAREGREGNTRLTRCLAALGNTPAFAFSLLSRTRKTRYKRGEGPQAARLDAA
jgi:hypothetical protein